MIAAKQELSQQEVETSRKKKEFEEEQKQLKEKLALVCKILYELKKEFYLNFL